MPTAQNLPQAVKTLDSVDLSGYRDLDDFADAFREYCEAGRKIAHYLTVQVAGAHGEVQGEVKRHLKALKVGNWRDTRKMLRKLDNAGDHFGDAAADYISAYKALIEMIMDVQSKLAEKAAKAKAAGSAPVYR
jgi:hypothetical protein